MPPEKRLGLNNPLLRRVQRHAAMTTLFSTAVPRSSVQPGQSAAGPVVQTAVLPALAAQPVEQPIAELTRPPVMPESASVTDEETAVAPATTSPPPAGAQPSSPSPQLSAEKTEGTSWQRLKNIFRKHQEKTTSATVVPQAEGEKEIEAQTEAEAEEPNVSHDAEAAAPPVIQRQEIGSLPASTTLAQSPPHKVITGQSQAAAAAPVTAVLRAEAEPETETAMEKEIAAERVNIIPEKHVRQTDSLPLVHDDDPITSAMPVFAQQRSASSAVPDSASDDDAPAMAETAVPETTPAPPALSRKVDGDDVSSRVKTSSASSTETIGDGRPPSDVLPTPTNQIEPGADTGQGVKSVTHAAEAAAALPPGSLDEIETSEMDEPALPLQAVWPVELTAPVRQQETSAVTPASLPTQPAEPASIQRAHDDLVDGRSSANATKVRDALQRVASGQPSDSSIELIPPRRQRPNIAAQESTPANAPPAAAPETAAAIQRQEAPGAPEQRAEPALVQTEIGALPADLWQILGAMPPAPVMETTTATAAAVPLQQPAQQAETTAAPSTAANPVQRAIDKAEAPSPPKPKSTGSETAVVTIQAAAQSAPSPQLPPAPPAPIAAPSLIQRTEETAAEPAADLTAPTAEPEESSEGETAVIDVDELAYRVYGNIKRRLSVEWERVRGRL